MSATTQLHGFGAYAHVTSPEDAVRAFLGDQADSFDVDGLTDAYRDAINEALEGTTIVLRGSEFFADYPAPEDSHELIVAALEAVDLGSLAEQYDRS